MWGTRRPLVEARRRVSLGHARRSPSSDPDIPAPPRTSAPLTPSVYGPANPFDPNTELGRAFIEHVEIGPSETEKWLQANMVSWHREDARLISTGVSRDEVLCTVELDHLPKAIPPPGRPHGDPFFDDYAHYALYLTITLSPRANVAQRWRESPRAMLDIMYGSKDSLPPDWLVMFEVGEGKGITFPRPRALVLALFAKLALDDENIERSLSEPMLQWAHAVSPISEARRQLKRIRKQSFHAIMGRHIGQRPRYTLRSRKKKHARARA